jgi:hypothetical protein
VTIKHVAMVLEAEGLDGAEKLLLIAYCNRTDDHGYCWPGQQRLADDCGTSVATVKRVKKRLIDKQLIASKRRIDPRTGEPISNLTRVNLELLGSMRRQAKDYDDNVIEQLTFDAGAPLPAKKQKAPRVPSRASDQVMVQDEPDPVDNSEEASDLLMAHLEPDPGFKMSPAPVQDEPDPGFKMSPAPVQDEPLTVREPPENHQGTVLPSVGSEGAASTDGERDGKKAAEVEIQLTEGVRLLQNLGLADPKLMLTGKPLRDQGAVVDDLLCAGWQVETLWSILSAPLPSPLRTSVGAVLAARLRQAADSPVPGPRRTRDDRDTPTPQRFTSGDDPVVRRRYECSGNHGMCGRPVEVQGDLCRRCERMLQDAQ